MFESYFNTDEFVPTAYSERYSFFGLRDIAVAVGNIVNPSPDDTVPFAPVFADLERIHYLVRSRKVTTILEFGVGFSTVAMDHALSLNEIDFKNDFKEKRGGESFRIACCRE